MVIIKDVLLKAFELRFSYTDINQEQVFLKQRQLLKKIHQFWIHEICGFEVSWFFIRLFKKLKFSLIILPISFGWLVDWLVVWLVGSF